MSDTSSLLTLIAERLDFETCISPTDSLFLTSKFSIDIFAFILFNILRKPILLSLSKTSLMINFLLFISPSAIKKAAEEGSPGTI